jgi:hypothetical protein
VAGGRRQEGLVSARRQVNPAWQRLRTPGAARDILQVRVELASHQDVVTLAERLASEGWPVVRRRRYLVAGANCGEDANGLAQAIRGYGYADEAIRVQRTTRPQIPL